MRRLLFATGLVGFFGFFGFLGFPTATFAYAPLTYRTDHFLFTLDPDLYPEWNAPEEVWTYNGAEIIPPASLRVDGDLVPPLPAGYAKTKRTGWRADAIRATIARKIAAEFDRPAGTVTISKSLSGSIVFDGVGLTGRRVDTDAATDLTLMALERNLIDIELPFVLTEPSVTVTDPELQKLGIKEVVTVGESNFSGSPRNRRHNIAVGLSKFNGHIIPQGTVFSFDDILGRVDGTTGYLKELVIKGDKTEPDYGGGLCQVSTTAYRGVWEYGFPIEQRKNHSYAVGYYGPQGTDATVYPPNPDMKFTNDGPSALLIQTYSVNDHAYFIYYGTKDKRQAEVWGPVVLGTRAAPPDKEILTTDLKPGERRKVGDRHPGITTLWFRTREPDPATADKKTQSLIVERVLSIYEARPLFYEVGVAALPEDTLQNFTPEGPADIRLPHLKTRN